MNKKYKKELEFQKKWATIFPQNKDKVFNYWKKYRAFDKIVKNCQISPVSRILDYGCGISTVLHFLPGFKVGFDPLADEYQKIYHYPKDIHVCTNLSYNFDKYQVAFCSNALDHIEKPYEAIKEIHYLLEQDGYFILTINIFDESHERDEAHPHSFTKRDIWDLIKKYFHVLYLEENPWYGLKNYVENKTEKSYGNELTLILRKM